MQQYVNLRYQVAIANNDLRCCVGVEGTDDSAVEEPSDCGIDESHAAIPGSTKREGGGGTAAQACQSWARAAPAPRATSGAAAAARR